MLRDAPFAIALAATAAGVLCVFLAALTASPGLSVIGSVVGIAGCVWLLALEARRA